MFVCRDLHLNLAHIAYRALTPHRVNILLNISHWSAVLITELRLCDTISRENIAVYHNPLLCVSIIVVCRTGVPCNIGMCRVP